MKLIVNIDMTNPTQAIKFAQLLSSGVTLEEGMDGTAGFISALPMMTAILSNMTTPVTPAPQNTAPVSSSTPTKKAIQPLDGNVSCLFVLAGDGTAVKIDGNGQYIRKGVFKMFGARLRKMGGKYDTSDKMYHFADKATAQKAASECDSTVTPAQFEEYWSKG
ncbi:MAG TPA: hypothetical protein HA355_03395 [Methanosphaera sp.]|nr:hypothetical protein [Methanosphaera sp.]